MKSKRWLLMNPPTGKYIRDTRCQASVEDIFAVAERAPVDLAYIAGALSANGHESFIRDYPAEGLSWEDMRQDIKRLDLDYVVINTTMFSYKEDLKVCMECKHIDSDITTIAKGAVFFHDPVEIMQDYPALDIAVAREEEKTFGRISSSEHLGEIKNVIYRSQNDIIKNPEKIYSEFELPMPEINKIDHKLYRRPDTNEQQATIIVGRGCPGRCIYCIAPIVGGSVARYREIAHIIEEIKLYYNNYGIRNFYFSADTFIWNHQWVFAFCEAVNYLDFNISWLCTARADRLSAELLLKMKNAGCWGVSIGIESGNKQIQKSIKKNLTNQTIINAMRLCKKYKMVTLLHFMLGFPWDSRETIGETIRLARKLNGNIMEFYIVTPLPGTELYEIVKNDSKLNLCKSMEQLNQITATTDTYYLTVQEITQLRKKALQIIYFNPFFYMNSLRYMHSFAQLKNCAEFILKKMRYIVLTHKK